MKMAEPTRVIAWPCSGGGCSRDDDALSACAASALG
jgi:hypothetical protein